MFGLGVEIMNICNCNIQLCTAVLFGLGVGIVNICGSAQTALSIFINTIHERRWTSMSDGVKLEYKKGVY
jgi:hypothetical protein